jgi:hypothetical protein
MQGSSRVHVVEKGGKFSSFDKHRQFLPLDHAFRGDTKNFTKDVTVTSPVPQKMATTQVRTQIDALVLPTQKGNPKKGKRRKLNPKKDKPKKNHFVGYGEKHMWTHKSGLVHGPDYDPRSEEHLDPELVLRIGQGKKHGRFYIGDDILDKASTPPLDRLRAASTSSSVPISQRPTAIESLQVSILTFINRSLTFMFFSSALLEHWCQMLQAEMQHLRQRQEALLAQREAELAEREAQMAEREVERERMQAFEVQTRGLLAFVQQLGEQQGWQIPAQLLAPPRPPPPPRRESTLVSVITIVLLYVLVFSVKPSDGRRAGFVDVSAFVPEMWLSAFVSTFFLQVLETSPCSGGAAEIFNFSLQLGFLSCYSHEISVFQRHSGASSNHVGGSLGSHVRASPAGASPGSHVGPYPPRARSGSLLS